MKPILVIVIAELFCTSLWFSANSAAGELQALWGIGSREIGWMTSAVQLGFITGTLLISISGIADRFRASQIFFVSSIVGAASNTAFALLSDGLVAAIVYRFFVGISLAGIYPLGMKMVISWTPGNSGSTLGWLVGMLTLGTALPFGIKALDATLLWQTVVLISSALALIGGWFVISLGDGPHLAASRNGSARPLLLGEALKAFRIPAFRSAAFGYFGHMWELYAFWTLVPLFVRDSVKAEADLMAPPTVAALTFFIIGAGAAGCILGGRFSLKRGSHYVAVGALTISGLICLIFPFLSNLAFEYKFLILLVWGVVVVADSPQFSSLSARACPQQFIGGALAIQNSIGFFITVCSIALTSALYPFEGTKVAWILALGPILGLISMRQGRSM